ncbi:hypothetical protein [Dactylosporangium sp. CA-139066]|uniref:hypothetical protein n=1 Tax=Dactylosporangium sp. CA-139066 TaxID=3239930 RepID=UPI003D9206B0
MEIYERRAAHLTNLEHPALLLFLADVVMLALTVPQVLDDTFEPAATISAEALWQSAARGDQDRFMSVMGDILDAVHRYIPEDEDGDDLPDREELLSLAGGVVLLGQDEDSEMIQRVRSAADLAVDIHQHLDSLINDPALLPPAHRPDITPLERAELERQIAVLSRLSRPADQALEDLRALTVQGSDALRGNLVLLQSRGMI